MRDFSSQKFKFKIEIPKILITTLRLISILIVAFSLSMADIYAYCNVLTATYTRSVVICVCLSVINAGYISATVTVVRVLLCER